MDQKIIGVDIGGTRSSVSQVMMNGNCLILAHKLVLNTGDSVYVARVIDKITLSIQELLRCHSLCDDQMGTIEISCAGRGIRKRVLFYF